MAVYIATDYSNQNTKEVFEGTLSSNVLYKIKRTDVLMIRYFSSQTDRKDDGTVIGRYGENNINDNRNQLVSLN